MSRAVDILVPPRLGTGFRWLLASSWTSNLGDGMAIAAGPLLVASLTDEPVLVAMAALLQWLPPLLFGVFAGALSDRLDRRLLVVTVDAIRSVVLVLLALSVLTDRVSIGLVLAALFLLATAEVFADNTSQTLLPMLVRRDDLAIANARLQTGFITVNQLAGPPLGATLFAAGMAFPFIGHAVLVGMGGVLIWRIRLPDHGRVAGTSGRIREEIAEGFRWVRQHAAIRTLVLTILIFNITFGAAWSVLVLYAARRLGLGEIGFGLLTTVIALGGIVGTSQLRLDHPSHQPGQHHARRPHHRDLHASGAGGDHERPGGDGDLLRLRGARLRLGDDIDDDPSAGGADRAPGPCRAA